MLTSVNTVPTSLRRWFIVHFVADVVVAVPLLAVPTMFLRTLGWAAVDPIAARMVGAAFTGIVLGEIVGAPATDSTPGNPRGTREPFRCRMAPTEHEQAGRLYC